MTRKEIKIELIHCDLEEKNKGSKEIPVRQKNR